MTFPESLDPWFCLGFLNTGPFRLAVARAPRAVANRAKSTSGMCLPQERRAQYGERVVPALGRKLELECGRGFAEKSLRHMIRVAEAFPDTRIVSALLRQFWWTHFLSIIYLGDSLQRDFCAETSKDTYSEQDLESALWREVRCRHVGISIPSRSKTEVFRAGGEFGK